MPGFPLLRRGICRDGPRTSTGYDPDVESTDWTNLIVRSSPKWWQDARRVAHLTHLCHGAKARVHKDSPGCPTLVAPLACSPLPAHPEPRETASASPSAARIPRTMEHPIGSRCKPGRIIVPDHRPLRRSSRAVFRGYPRHVRRSMSLAPVRLMPFVLVLRCFPRCEVARGCRDLWQVLAVRGATQALFRVVDGQHEIAGQGRKAGTSHL